MPSSSDPVLFPTPRLLSSPFLDRSIICLQGYRSRIIRSSTWQIRYTPLWFVSRQTWVKSFALLQDLLATIIIFCAFSEKVFIPYLYPPELMNKTRKDDSFFLYIYLTLESRPRQRDTKFFEPRLFFHLPKKEKEHSFRQVVFLVKLRSLGKYIFRS